VNVNKNEIENILKTHKKICVIGLSPDMSKPSYGVPHYMQQHGYDVVGVYPRGEETAGMKIYPTLADVPVEYRSFINVFRRSEAIPDVVDEVLKLGGCEVLWLQLGIVNLEAEKKAEAAGIQVVSDLCLKIEHGHFI
jgi:uncharacterized protein